MAFLIASTTLRKVCPTEPGTTFRYLIQTEKAMQTKIEQEHFPHRQLPPYGIFYLSRDGFFTHMEFRSANRNPIYAYVKTWIEPPQKKGECGAYVPLPILHLLRQESMMVIRRRNLEMRMRTPASLPIEWKGNLMTFIKNEFGVPQYPDGDARRLFVLLAAIDLLERPTISAIADLTSLHRDTIATDIAVLHEQYGVTLHKLGEVYRIESWGDVLKKQGVKKFLKAQFN